MVADERMNVSQPLLAHVVFRFGVGGLENGIVNLINHLPRERWRHAIISLTDVAPDFTERIARPDVCYVALGKRPGHLAREYPRLLRVLKGLRPAIVHTRNLAALEAVVPAWAAGVPVRIHGEHGWDVQDPEGKRRRYRLVRRLYRPFVNHYVALSNHLSEYLQNQVGVAAATISQIYNGVDTARFHPAADAHALIPGCPFHAPGHWLIGSVGRLESIKDPVNLARAFVRTLKMHPAASNHLRLVVVGDGALRQQVESVLARARVSELAWFAGERADVPDFMRGLDCFVLPSLAEGVSNTILEAMATRLPVVATRVGGNAELIESGMTGTLVSRGDPDALAQAILAYFNDRATARRHAKAAQQVAMTRFSLMTMIAAYARVYERTLAAAGVHLPPSGREVKPPPASSQTTPLQSASNP
jgi:sugar transferase (PEP-CTERM/EpsH1 system associated)